MSLEFVYSFGFRNVKNCVVFYNENTALFSAGKLCILFDLISKTQRSFQFTENAEISSIVRCGIQIAAAIKGNPPTVCLFNTLSEAKTYYTGSDFMQSLDFVCLSVSSSMRFVAAQGGCPDWILLVWLSNTRDIVATLKPTSNIDDAIHDISFNAAGSDELVIVGSKVFKLYEYQEETDVQTLFVEHTFEKSEKSANACSICWPQKENLAVGTSEGEIIFYRGIKIIYEIAVKDDVQKLFQGGILEIEQDNFLKAVTSTIVTSKQLLCVYGGFIVLIYDGEEIDRYALNKYVLIPSEKTVLSIPGVMERKPDFIKNIICSPNGKNLLASTRDGQLLHLCQTGRVGGNDKFTVLLRRQHHEPIIGMDIARSRPLIATCSQHVAILWNYYDKSQEMRHVFTDSITSISIHPTGNYVGLSFDHFCRIFSILYDGLRERNFIPCRYCSGIRFSNGGHIFAVLCISVLEIYSFLTSQLLFKLHGHASSITCIEWKDNDFKLLSCDSHGRICEWNLENGEKIWENTTVVSYSSIAVNPLAGHVTVVASDKCVRCFDRGSILWILNVNKGMTCITFNPIGEEFFVGTIDGLILAYTHPTSSEFISIYSHSGNVCCLKSSYACDFLFSAGTDSSLFLWKILDNTMNRKELIFLDLSLIDSLNLVQQNNKIKMLRLSLQNNALEYDCKFELNCVKHQRCLKTIAVNHENTTHELNDKIAHIKEVMQTFLFDSDSKEDLKNIENNVRKDIINTTLKLSDAYKKSRLFACETSDITLNYDNIMLSLTNKHAKFTCAERSDIEEISKQIKVIEDTLVIEKEITENMKLACDENKVKIREESLDKSSNFTCSHKIMLENEKSTYMKLQQEIEKLKMLTLFNSEDTKLKRNVTSGQIDYDITEKVHSVSFLKEDYYKLECNLEAKEKVVQNQEKKFYDMRKLVGETEKRYSVLKDEVEELYQDINVKQLQVESIQKKIQSVKENIPILEEDTQLTDDLCSTLTEKLKETVEGFHKKQKLFRDTEEVISKYISMLHKCLSRSCDPVRLKVDILYLFEHSKIGFVDETDLNLINEYEFQVEKLKSSYEMIKGEPAKAMRNKSMAEFRLSQQNSKVLDEVHDLQKSAEKLRNVMCDMEIGLGMHVAQLKNNKIADELRRKIEFVIDTFSTDKGSKFLEISKLDKIIEEQQREIERFKTILAGKER